MLEHPAEPPRADDTFENGLSRTTLMNPYLAGVGSGLFALVALYRSGVVVDCLASLAIGAVVFLIFWAQRRAMRWLGERHGWNNHVRGFLAWLILASPLFLLLACVAIATTGRR